MKLIALVVLFAISASAQIMDADQAKIWTLKHRAEIETKCQKDSSDKLLGQIRDAIDDGICQIGYDEICDVQFEKYSVYTKLMAKGYKIAKNTDDMGGPVCGYTISWCSP